MPILTALYYFPCSSCRRETYGVENAVFQVIRGGVVPLDMATVQLADGTSTYMSLLAGFGLVADVDIESEKFRKLGKSRFILG
jgi:sphingosine kinase